MPEGKTAKNRFHIDIRVAGGRPVDPAQHEQWVRATSAELVGAGATVVREEAYGDQLGPAGLEPLKAWLDGFWQDALDSFAEHVRTQR